MLGSPECCMAGRYTPIFCIQLSAVPMGGRNENTNRHSCRCFTDLLGVDVETVKKVLASWGPRRFDAELDKDGKAFRPDGKQAGTLIPPAFGLAGVNLHTWTGFGSVPYWSA